MIRFLPYLITRYCMHVISAIWEGVEICKKYAIAVYTTLETDKQLPNRGRSVIVEISRIRPNTEGDNILDIVTALNKIVTGSLISLSARTWYKIIAPSDTVGTMTMHQHMGDSRRYLIFV